MLLSFSTVHVSDLFLRHHIGHNTADHLAATMVPDVATAPEGAVLGAVLSFWVAHQTGDMIDMRDTRFVVADGHGDAAILHYDQLDPQWQARAGDCALRLYTSPAGKTAVSDAACATLSAVSHITHSEVKAFALHTGLLLCVPARSARTKHHYTALLTHPGSAHETCAQEAALLAIRRLAQTQEYHTPSHA